MEGPSITNETICTKALYLALQKEYFRRFRGGYRRICLGAATALWAVALLFFRTGDRLGLLYAGMGLLTFYGALWGWHLPALWNLQRMKKQLGKKSRFCLWEFGMEVSDPSGERFVPYPQIDGLVECPLGIGLFHKGKMEMLAKEGLTPKDVDVKAFLLERCPQLQ